MSARRAKLGMRITGGGDDGPPPGSKEFGERAQDRIRRILGRTKPLGRPDPEQDEKVAKGLRTA